MTHINLITADDLQLFKKELLNEIRLLLMPVSIDRKWMKGNEIRGMLNISQATLQKLRSNESIKFTKIGSVHYYKLSDPC